MRPQRPPSMKGYKVQGHRPANVKPPVNHAGRRVRLPHHGPVLGK